MINKSSFLFCIFNLFLCGNLYSQIYRLNRPLICGFVELKERSKMKPCVCDPIPGAYIYSDSFNTYAVMPGEVVFSIKVEGCYTIGIKYKEYTWMYSHIDTPFLKKGQFVLANQSIGKLTYDSEFARFYFHLQIFKGKRRLTDTELLKEIGVSVK